MPNDSKKTNRLEPLRKSAPRKEQRSINNNDPRTQRANESTVINTRNVEPPHKK
ncbi:Uncharacterised protein [Listeria grayi]|uniref:Uncharacterized protein n=1 Tax=Listeria grayi TaxID=1641 RepID=A0A378MGM1_LISGR|nr:hypothetical protein [Listeria grayi]STY45509.1 Uncharacterised protein [Listeria grayi]